MYECSLSGEEKEEEEAELRVVVMEEVRMTSCLYRHEGSGMLELEEEEGKEKEEKDEKEEGCGDGRDEGSGDDIMSVQT